MTHGRSLLRQSVWAALVMILSITLHFWLLDLADRLVSTYPSVTDLLLLNIPLLRVGLIGESWFLAYLLIFAWLHFRHQRERTPRLFLAIALFYLIRGLFLFLFPIGSPVGKPEDAFAIYPHADHGYFPGGHVGLMTLLALSLADRRWRLGLFAAAIIFGLGTMLTRAHYTADTMAGMINAFAVTAFFGLAPVVRWRL